MARMTQEEILEKFPTWNCERHDPIAVYYGDEPLVVYDEQEYNDYKQLTDNTLLNLGAIDAYIYTQYGKFYRYVTLIGEVYIAEDGRVLTANINIEYKGKTYNLIINALYAFTGFYFQRISTRDIKVYTTAKSSFSPLKTAYTPLDNELVQTLISLPLSDYGIAIQKVMEYVRSCYAADPYNYLDDKLNEYIANAPKPIHTTVSKASYLETVEALSNGIKNYLDFCTHYPEESNYVYLVPIAEEVLKNIDNISTRVLEYFIFPIDNKNSVDKVKRWLYKFRDYCLDGYHFLSLKEQNERLKNYPHYDASVKKPKCLGDYK